MEEKSYILKEIELQYEYRRQDGETYSKIKHLVNDLFKSIKGSVTCEFGGFESLGFNDEEIKGLIRQYIEAQPESLIK